MAELRALIVDDDVRFAAALGRALGPYGIEPRHVASVPDALAYFAKARCDVLVLDVRLGKISGLTFLKTLAARGMPVPVVLVSGYARTKERHLAHSLGVPLVDKPFRIQQLIGVIEGVTGRVLVHEKTSKPVEDEGPTPIERMRTTLRRVTREIALGKRDLPVLDPRVEEGQALLRSGDPSLEQVLDMVDDDPMLCGRLMRSANASVRSGDQIKAVSKAIVRLGTRESLDIVLQALMRQSFDVSSRAHRELIERMWKQGLAVARLSAFIAQHRPPLDPEEMRLAGLMHNCGELLLVCAAAELPDEIVREVPIDALLEEIALLHESVGELLLDAWRLPDPLPEWAGRHHGEGLERGPAALELAWTLARAHGFPYVQGETPEVDVEIAARQLGVPHDDLLVTLERVRADLEGDPAEEAEEESGEEARREAVA